MKSDACVTLQARKQLALLDCIIVRELSGGKPSDCKPPCPHCGSGATNKRGYDARERQRYYCKRCHRSFTDVSMSELGSTNLPLETWLTFAECHMNQMTLRDSASACNVSLKTAWYMRKRLGSTLAHYAQQVKQNLRHSKTTSMA